MIENWNEVPKGTPVILFGAGNLCKIFVEGFLEELENHGTFDASHIWGVADNSPSKTGRASTVPQYPPEMGHHIVFSPETVISFCGDVETPVFVILIHVGAEEAIEQLKSLGVSEERIAHWWTLWKHYQHLILPEWADCTVMPKGSLTLWSDPASMQAVAQSYEFLQKHVDRTAPVQFKKSYSLDANMYFDHTVYRPLESEWFVDCGAFDGDTARAFIKAYHGNYHYITAFEPNARDLLVYVEEDTDFRGEVFPYALVGSREQTEVLFDSDSGISARISDTGRPTATWTLDSCLVRRLPTLIKIDVEGAELDVLRGGVETLKRHRPVIACCLYHKPQDLWEIPQFLSEICTGYKFFARCYEPPSWEMVMYAVPEERVV